MKKILLLFLAIFLTACATNSTKNEKNIIELNPNHGEVKKIAMQDIIKKMDDKESFVVMLSQNYCSSCKHFFMDTDAYTKEIGLTLWDIVLDDEPTSTEENLEITNKQFGYFKNTPSIYYIEKGVVKDSLCSDKTEPTLENYKKFLTKNNIVKE